MDAQWDAAAATALVEMLQDAASARTDMQREFRLGLMSEPRELAVLMTRGWVDDLGALADALNWDVEGRQVAAFYADRWAFAHVAGLGVLVGGEAVPRQG